MFDADKTYWNDDGKYQKEFDELVELMPPSGPCDTVAGELIRAANRLAHDFYNNGMGNNTSGAINFLDNYGVFKAEDRGVFDTIHDYTRGRLYEGDYNGDGVHRCIERMVDLTVEYILENPHTRDLANEEDIFDYEEEFQHFCEGCGEDLNGSYGWNSLCDECTEDEEEEWA